MKTGQFLTNPASAIFLAAFLAFPMHALALSDGSPFGRLAPKPVCVYKGVMSDAEIDVCTGFQVHYDYAIYSGRASHPRPLRERRLLRTARSGERR